MTDSYGSLSVRTYTAGGAVPIPDARVRILGAQRENESVLYSLVTDSDGKTEKIYLPTPPLELSETPDPTSSPFALYNLEIDAAGYYPKRIYSVTLFPSTESILPIALIPDDGVLGDYPRGNINAIIPQNEDLE